MKKKITNVRATSMAMPALYFKIAILLIPFVFLNSCSIKKRIYMPGYYVSWYSFNKGESNRNRKEFVSYSFNAYDALCVKPTQETCVNVMEPVTIICNEGTVVEIPGNAFEYESGAAIKCTKVCVYVWEYYTLTDILAAGLTTTSNRKMLFSDGMIYIEARCFGERLRLKQGKEITVQMPSSAPDNQMKIFAGKFQNGIIDWKVKGSPEISSNSETMSESYDYEGEMEPGNSNVGYLMKLSSMGWINCDRFYDIQKKTTLQVKVQSVKNTVVALIFKEIKSIMPGYCFSNNTIEFANLPDGQEVTLLAYSVDEKTKSARACTYDLLLGETKEIDLKMSEMDLDELKSLLASFN